MPVPVVPASFPVLPALVLILQLWKKVSLVPCPSFCLHSCEIKAEEGLGTKLRGKPGTNYHVLLHIYSHPQTPLVSASCNRIKWGPVNEANICTQGVDRYAHV